MFARPPLAVNDRPTEGPPEVPVVPLQPVSWCQFPTAILEDLTESVWVNVGRSDPFLVACKGEGAISHGQPQ